MEKLDLENLKEEIGKIEKKHIFFYFGSAILFTILWTLIKTTYFILQPYGQNLDWSLYLASSTQFFPEYLGILVAAFTVLLAIFAKMQFEFNDFKKLAIINLGFGIGIYFLQFLLSLGLPAQFGSELYKIENAVSALLSLPLESLLYLLGIYAFWLLANKKVDEKMITDALLVFAVGCIASGIIYNLEFYSLGLQSVFIYLKDSIISIALIKAGFIFYILGAICLLKNKEPGKDLAIKFGIGAVAIAFLGGLFLEGIINSYAVFAVSVAGFYFLNNKKEN